MHGTQPPIYNCQIPAVDVEEFDNFTGHDEWYAVFTIQLGELIESKVFDWTRSELDWSSAAYNEDQYKRICDYFIERFRYREISIKPFLEWAQMLKRKLVFELMPKYIPLYQRVDEGIDPLSKENEYYKNRTINSSYPETLLSGNSDYVTDGKDEEFQRITEADFTDRFMHYAEIFKSVDELLLNDLETMFISMYTLNSNTSW